MWSVGMWMNACDEKTMFNELKMVDGWEFVTHFGFIGDLDLPGYSDGTKPPNLLPLNHQIPKFP